MIHRPVRDLLVLGAGLAAAMSGPAAAAPSTVTFNIAPGTLEQALLAYAAQSRRQLLLNPGSLQGLTSPGLHLRLPPEAALERLVAGTGATATTNAQGVVIVRRASEGPSTAGGALGADGTAPAGPGELEPVATVSELTVTGTLIRGAAEGPSPVTTLTHEQIDRSGRATVADALATLPQVFNGTSTPQTRLIGSDGTGTNFLAATGINLRGLGANSTLVLVNGRRLPGAGARGDFADVGAIPTAAVERVEVLLDGASALYGSDAVGGVVNVILRKDFDGAEIRLRGGGATRGGAGQDVLAATFGRTWSAGRLVLSYEHEDRDRLAAANRRQTRDADLRSLGGDDLRSFSSLPGNILLPTATGAYAPVFAIPATGDGRPRPQDFVRGQVNLENFRALGDVLPEQTRDSGYLHLEQDLSPRLHLEADARYTRREVAFALPGQLGLLQVTRANPFFVAPDGAASEVIGYAFGREIGPIRASGVTDTATLSAGAGLDLGRTWRIDLYADFAEEADHQRTRGLINTGFLNEALGLTPDNPLTSYSAARDGFFNPFGAGTANGTAVLDFIGSGEARNDTRSRVETLNLKADGVLFALPGGDARAAVGGQLRQEYFKTTTIARQTGPVTASSGGLTFARAISAAFTEIRIPVFGPANALPGLRRLELSLAGRIEDYEDAGLTGAPKLGLVWSPASSLTVRASYGTSFRAPALPETFAVAVIAPALLARGPDRIVSLVQYGGDATLRPESAVTWTAGAEWRPGFVRGLVLSAGFFDIAYKDRIGQPVLENVAAALSDPSFAPFVERIDPARNPADLARVRALLARSTSASAGLFPAESYGALVNARFVNAANLHVRGVDGAIAYGRSFGPSRIDLAFSATYLADYARRLTPTAGEVQLAGVSGQPAALRVRSTASWSRAAFGATFGVNRVDGSTTLTGAKVDPWTTVDAQLVWRAPNRSGPLARIDLALSAVNLLDASPPFYNSPNAVGYDPANADVLGRTLSLQLIKRW